MAITDYGSGPNGIMQSTDGINWKEGVGSNFSRTNWADILYTGSSWVAVSYSTLDNKFPVGVSSSMVSLDMEDNDLLVCQYNDQNYKVTAQDFNMFSRWKLIIRVSCGFWTWEASI